MLKSISKRIHSKLSGNENNELKYDGIKICLIYLAIGFMWIYFSDRIVNTLVMNKDLILILNTYKGWFYVIVTSIILYLLISNLLKKVYFAEKKLTDSYDELAAANEELQAYLEQLTSSEEELRNQYDQTIENQIKLSKSEEKYKTLVNQMQLGLALYEGSFDEGVVNYILIDANDSHEVLTGLKKKDILGKRLSQIFPNMEIDNIDKLEHTQKTGEPIRYERYQQKTNIYYEIIAYRPKNLQLAIIVNDITQRKLAEEAIKISEYNFRNIFESSSDAIFIIDENKVIDCNTATIFLLGYQSKDSILGKSPSDLSPRKQPNGELSSEKIFDIYNYSIMNGKYRFEWWHQRPDGSLIPVEIIITSIILNGKKVFHFLCRDISERKQMEQKLEYLSYHDQLTGLYNRRFFEQELSRLDVEESLPMTIAMADINGLKLINDSFGHAVGDECLRKVADVITKGCRAKDIVCRLAGDEFVIISPNTNNSEVERIVENIKLLALKEKVGLVDVSISFGYETKRNKEDLMLDVLKKAEDYMYRKKLYESPSMRGKTIHAIITTLHEKNSREEQHSRRVSELCESMGNALGLPEDAVRELKIVGLLHDIGKIGIEESILNKNGKLTNEEWEEVKKHPEIGYRILSTVNDFSEMAEYVLAHHERWDGKGYPKGLKGQEIPLQARIITIADAYDAMISERSYRNPLTKEAAIQELKSNVGLQFNPEYVEVFIEKVLKQK